MKSIRSAVAGCLGLIVYFVGVSNALCHSIEPDPSFGTNGAVFSFLPDKFIKINSGVRDVSGRIVLAGYTFQNGTSHFLLVRYTVNGELDHTFGTAGFVSTDFFGEPAQANGVAIQFDGKIIATGYARLSGNNLIALARYDPDGSLDNTFDGDGKVTTSVSNSNSNSASAIALQADNKIVVAGWAGPGVGTAVVRYNPDGSRDNTFGPGNGIVITEWEGEFSSFQAVEIAPNNDILAAGYAEALPCCNYNFTLARYRPNGSLDASFGNNGTVAIDAGYDNEIGEDIAIQSDGKILIAGGTNGSEQLLALLRFRANGSLDGSFGTNGIVTRGFPSLGLDGRSVLMQNDGKIVLAGSAGTFTEYRSRIAVARFNKNGTSDQSFGNNGVYTQALDGPSGHCWGMTAFFQTPQTLVVGGFAGVRPLMPFAQDKIFAARYRIPNISTLFDYDGDGRSDISLYRRSHGLWFIGRSSAGEFVFQLGTEIDMIVPADYDGDGKADPAVYRPSSGDWYIYASATETYSVYRFGLAEDVPAPGDYDGDGQADPAVFRPSNGTWYIEQSTAGLRIEQFGASGDVPAPGDYDGDGKNDLVVWRPTNGVWYERRSTGTDFAIQFGTSTDKIAPADYDGDGKTDVGIYRPSQGTWYSVNSSDGGYPVQVFGLAGDIPVAADYDGDGRADIGLFRPSDRTWYINRTTSGLLITQYGLGSDVPTPSAYGNVQPAGREAFPGAASGIESN